MKDEKIVYQDNGPECPNPTCRRQFNGKVFMVGEFTCVCGWQLRFESQKDNANV